MELLFWAIIAVLFIYKLIALLGRVDINDEEQARERRQASRFGCKGYYQGGEGCTAPMQQIQDVEILSGLESKLSNKIRETLRIIKENDKNFTIDAFLIGVRKAFPMIIGAFASGDTKALSYLLSNALYQMFVKDINARLELGNKLERKVLKVDSVEVDDVTITGTVVQIYVNIQSMQSYILRDSLGHVIDGAEGLSIRAEDKWVFQRDLSSGDIWALIETG